MEYRRKETLVPALTGSKRGRTALEAHALRHLHTQIPDPELRQALTPSYRIGCKRIVFSDTFYPALCRPTTTLVTSPITELASTAIHTADGRQHEIDVLVHATGFHVSAALMRVPIHGRHRTSLQEIWTRNGAAAHLGTTVAELPNAFILGGPNTGVGHTSILFMLKSQFRYIAAALDAADRALVVRKQAHHRFTTRLHRASAATTWTRGGCHSWYLDREGLNRSLWPDPHGATGYTPEHSIATTTGPFEHLRARHKERHEATTARRTCSRAVPGHSLHRRRTGPRVRRSCRLRPKTQLRAAQ